ncbi:unnamed protein product, partial [Prorocentrum cordatum]
LEGLPVRVRGARRYAVRGPCGPGPPAAASAGRSGMEAAVTPQILEALGAVLPEDAPAEHDAWHKVTFSSKHPARCAIKLRGVQCQTTLAACLTEEATLRVARACYVKLSAGESKEQVIKFRDEIYASIKGIMGITEAPPERH